MGTSTFTGMRTPTRMAALMCTLPENRPRILVAGLGNLLLGDDGVGVHAVHALQADPPPGSLAVEVGTAVLDALHLYEWADAILAIDAMRAGGRPGTVYAFGLADVADEGVRHSLHEVNLLGALRFLPEAHRPRVGILGVEPQTIDYRTHLSLPVAAALPRVVQAARETIVEWQREWAGKEVRRPA